MELYEDQIVQEQELAGREDAAPEFETESPESRAPHSNRFGWVWTTLVAGALVAAAAWLLSRGHGGHTESHKEKSNVVDPIVVTVARVEPREVQRSVEVVGSLFGRDEIGVTGKVGGRATAIYHDVGDTVRPGDLLLEIDPTDYELAVEESRRGLELELAKLGLDKLPTDDFKINKLPVVVRAQAEEQNAASRFQRVSQLSRGGSITAEERDAAEKSLTIAQANYQQALLDAQTTLATVRHRQAALDSALQKLRDTKVIVPGSQLANTKPQKASQATQPTRLDSVTSEYVVSRRMVSEGEMISSSGAGETLLFELVIDRPLKLKATVPERHRSELAAGQQVDVRVEYFPSEVFRGQVSRVSPAVDRASRTFQVEILIPNDDRRLSAGSFAQAKILTSVDGNAATVPEEALVSFAGVTKLFVVENNLVREVPVVVQRSLKVRGSGSSYEKSWVEVSGEIKSGALIVTSGQSQLSSGAAVKVRADEVARRD